jgi:DNA repair exonuclease SbcCD ATPase subunit
MRRLKQIVYENWACYSHVDIALEAKIYAVVARHVDDPGRSNWLGKSAFGAGVKFGLDGDHDARTENGWIRKGQKSGLVSLLFDDDSLIKRSRVLGKSTQLEYWRPGEKVAMGEDAQALINQAIGLSAIDRAATCFLEQGMMSRMLRMQPSARLEIVSSWFRLESIGACQEDVGTTAANLSWRAEQASNNLKTVRATIEREIGEGETFEKLQERIEKTKERIEVAEGRLASAQDALEKNATLAAAVEAIAEYKRVEKTGIDLKAEADALGSLDKLQEAFKKADLAATKALAERNQFGGLYEQKKEVAAGNFDGACPVADIKCPATALINSQRVVNGKAAKKARDEFNEACSRQEAAEQARRRAQSRLQEVERKHDRLASLRVDLKRLYPKYVAGKKLGEPQDPDALREAVDTAQSHLITLKSQLGSLERSVAMVLAAREEERKLALHLEVIEKELTTQREAIVFFKALKRRVAERSLAQIEEGANSVLGESGIDLGLELQWSREGEGVAKTCEACGHPFPPSKKVKQCERCGADRGANLIDKLEPVLTNRSGGALDLAGLALQLSASRWLRDDRMSPWSTAFIDEPYGQLDETNRRALSAHIAGMLRGRYGFEQAFLIAHHSSVLDALPGRIEISAQGSRENVVSTARVVC